MPSDRQSLHPQRTLQFRVRNKDSTINLIILCWSGNYAQNAMMELAISQMTDGMTPVKTTVNKMNWTSTSSSTMQTAVEIICYTLLQQLNCIRFLLILFVISWTRYVARTSISITTVSGQVLEQEKATSVHTQSANKRPEA